MRGRLLAVCLGLGLASLSVEARADDSAPPPPRRVVFEGQTGVYAPLGQMGAALSVDTLPWLSLSVGVGRAVNLNVYDSPTYVPRTRLLFLPRARLWESGGTALRGGLGLLYGESRADDHSGLRLYGELSIEHNWPGGLQLRLFGGGGRMLHEFRPEQADARNAPYAAYAGLGVGYAILPNPAIEPGPASLGGRWYGWQGLVLGMASLSIYSLTSVERQTPYPQNPHALDDLAEQVLPVAYLVTGPMVHYAHRRYARAVASFVMRLAIPALCYRIGDGMTIGDSTRTRASDGAIVGAVIAALIDAFALGWEPRAPAVSAPTQ